MCDCFEKAAKKLGDREITIKTRSLPAKQGELTGMY